MAGVQSENLVSYEAQMRAGVLADEDLVEQFLRGDQIVAGDAFMALVERHGPMVLGICRLVLDQEADAEDAFQATFLVLARKAASIRNRAVLAAWLHEVANRTAIKARVNKVRRRSLERQSVSMLPSRIVPDRAHHDAAWNELRPVLHDEVRRLPDKYRIPVILSYLEGKTNEEVAELLQWPVGTVKGRLSRARELLRSRLTRRGMALSAAFLVTALTDGSVFAEVVPPELVKRTMLFVRKLNPRQAFPGPSSAQPSTELSIRARLETLAASAPQHPILALVLLAVLSVSTVIGIVMTIDASENSSLLRSAFSALIPARAAATSCH
jgi:RNA polymerase sigma factor (sigma-70 family)